MAMPPAESAKAAPPLATSFHCPLGHVAIGSLAQGSHTWLQSPLAGGSITGPTFAAPLWAGRPHKLPLTPPWRLFTATNGPYDGHMLAAFRHRLSANLPPSPLGHYAGLILTARRVL